MASRRLEDLHPIVGEKAKLLVDLALVHHIEILITSTLRTFTEQADLYALGRSKPGKKVTNAQPGQSWHNFGLAFDVVPVVNGKAVWNDQQLWDQIGGLGKSLGLTWGGGFKTIKDKPHFEYHPGLTLLEANKRKEISEPLIRET